MTKCWHCARIGCGRCTLFGGAGEKIPGREARTTAAVVRSLVDAEVLYSLGNGNRVHINTASSLSLFVCFPSFRLRLLSFIVVFLLFF